MYFYFNLIVNIIFIYYCWFDIIAFLELFERFIGHVKEHGFHILSIVPYK
jgi:hypothetical protein